MTVLPTVAVANYFIGKAQQEGKEITPMKVLKLVYIAHGWHLGLLKTPLIGEQIQAWRYGPVIDSVYQDFKEYGRNQIPRQKLLIENGQAVVPTVTDPEKVRFLDAIWHVYKDYNGLQLSAMTHQVGTPWYATWSQGGGSEMRGAVIPQDEIQRHYEQLARERQPATAQ